LVHGTKSTPPELAQVFSTEVRPGVSSGVSTEVRPGVSSGVSTEVRPAWAELQCQSFPLFFRSTSTCCKLQALQLFALTATTSLPYCATISFTTMLLYRTINTHLCPRVGNACVSVSVRARAYFSSQNIDEVRAEFTRQSGNFENEWTTCMYSLQAQHG
jgi:hypothetical protein